MIKTDNAENFRRSRIDLIHRKEADRAEKLRQLRRETDELEAAQLTIHQEMARAQSFDPSRGICPRCAIDDGKSVELIAIPIGTIIVDEIQQGVDLMRCPECGWDDTVTP